MQPIKVELPVDRPEAQVSVAGKTVQLTAHQIDELIHTLAAARARMTPVHPAVVPDEPAGVHRSDNLLWSVRAAPDRAAIEFAMHHPGLGWSAMWLSRAQVEDLQTSIEFELARLPGNG